MFCFDRVFLSRPDFSWNRFLFFLKTLEQLKKQIESTGGTLIILEQGPREAFPKLLNELKQSVGLPATITWNRDYEPFARHRDSAMEDLFKNEFKIEPRTARDHLLIEPNELSKGTSIEEGVYQVFTPFKKKW